MQDYAGQKPRKRSPGDPWYTPERVRILLLNWASLAAQARSGDSGNDDQSEFYSDIKATDQTTASFKHSLSKRTKRANPQGGFEDRSCIKADLHAALMSLDMDTRKVIALSYIMGFTDVEIQLRTGLSVWKVRTAHVDGIERVARFLGWIRRAKTSVVKPSRRQHMRSALRNEAALEVARALDYCPAVGVPDTSCVVCGALYASDGKHVGPMRGRG